MICEGVMGEGLPAVKGQKRASRVQSMLAITDRNEGLVISSRQEDTEVHHRLTRRRANAHQRGVPAQSRSFSRSNGRERISLIAIRGDRRERDRKAALRLVRRTRLKSVDPSYRQHIMVKDSNVLSKNPF